MLSKEQRSYLTATAVRWAENLDIDWIALLNERGITEATARRFKLGVIDRVDGTYAHHAGWLAIPYLAANGEVVGFKFRRPDSGTPKYGSPTGQKSHLFNVSDVLLANDTIAICEGELDTIIASGELGIPAVGVPGVANWKPHFARLLEGYRRVLIVADNDLRPDGTNPGMELAKRLTQDVLNTRVVVFDEGQDLTDFYVAHGKQATLARMGLAEAEQPVMVSEFPF
jgi:DNA primase